MGRMILLKLQPNQDVTEGLEAAARDAGMARARICGAVGSLVEAVVLRGDAHVHMPGPGLEIGGLSGIVDAGGGSSLSGFICGTDTRTQYGRFARGRNAVGITFEVVLEGLE